jgi:diguanylate cyclase (GGDEF)-like protein
LDDTWLVRFGGGRLAARIVTMSLLLLLVVQLAGFSVVRNSITRNARAQLETELRVGERIWKRLLDTNAQRLRQGAMLLSADYGFRAAVTSGDDETIRSALENHGARIGATVGALLDTEFRPRVLQTGSADPALLSPLLHDLGGQTASEVAGQRLAIVDGRPHQFVVVPLRAPLTIGWVVMGFPLGQELAQDMHALSGLQVAMLVDRPTRIPRLVATTLDEAAGAALAPQSLVPLGEVVVNGEALYVRTVRQDAWGGTLRTVLLRSVAEVVAPFEEVQVVLAVITALGVVLFALGSAWTARRVTTPLRALVQASETLGRGDYAAAMQGTERRDEIGDLARAFDQMRIDIAANEAEMRELAYVDRLTGLPNRARLRDVALAAMRVDSATAPARRVAMIFLDLNRFKHVNDVLGYAVGDRLLKAVAERLERDVVRAGDLVARLGGDEFALLLPDSGVDSALRAAQRIAASFEQPLMLDDQTLDIHAAVGIACCPDHADDVDALLGRAEIAMYGAKRSSEVAVIYDAKSDSTSAQTLSLLSQLRHAVEAGELRLFLQPKIALRGGQVVGAEALLRWQHPQRGLLPPMQFIPFAEQTGFVRRLTLWAFEESARQWAGLQAHGPLRISVNLSTRDLMDLDLPHKLDTLLRRHGAPEHGFCLEITESAIMDDPARAETVLNALSARGFKLSIDDFGTGYSSLAYLRRLPVDELKIDRSFVMALEADANDAKIVRSTIDLAHNLGLSVVAEGIENAAVMAQLAALACDEGQGYHMSRPMPLGEFTRWRGRWSQAPHAQAEAPGTSETPTAPADVAHAIAVLERS